MSVLLDPPVALSRPGAAAAPAGLHDEPELRVTVARLADRTLVVRQSLLPPPSDLLPAALVPIFRGQLEAHQHRIRGGTLFDGQVVLLRQVATQRLTVTLDVQAGSYIAQSALKGTYQEAASQGLLDSDDFIRLHPAFGVSTGAWVVVITSDSRILVTKRSARASVDPGCYSLALGEHMEPGDIPGDAGALPSRIAARALHEELGVSLTLGEQRQFIHPTLMLARTSSPEWLFLLVADFRRAGRRFCADAIESQLAFAKDAWESQTMTFVPFDHEALRDFLRGHRQALAAGTHDLVNLVMAQSWCQRAQLWQ